MEEQKPEAPNDTRKNEKVLGRWERWRSKEGFCCCLFVLACFDLKEFSFGMVLQGSGKGMKGMGRGWDWGAWCEIPKDPIKKSC